MALVTPLRGVRYDTGVVDLGACLAPPYDVIDEAEQQQLYARDLRNIVRIDDGLEYPGDESGTDDRYTRAAAHLDAWLRLGVLRRDSVPALYVVDHEFRAEGGGVRRRTNLLARVRALPWESADVLAHERTMRAPKEDRLRLMRATRMQTSAVFCLYDTAPGLDELLAGARERSAPAVADLDGEAGKEHIELRVVDEPATLAAAVEALRCSRLYIADGHHRFETAAAYGAERRDRGGAGDREAGGAEADFDWTLVALSAADDPGIQVLPTHRLVRPGAGIPEGLAALLERLPARWTATRQPTLAVALGAAHRLTGRAHAVVALAADGVALLVAEHDPGAAVWRRLDVTTLEEGVLAGACGIGAERIAEGAVGFARSVAEAEASVASGTAVIALILNSPTTAELIDVSDAGEQMPQKSTYFSPKVPTGLVLSPL